MNAQKIAMATLAGFAVGLALGLVFGRNVRANAASAVDAGFKGSDFVVTIKGRELLAAGVHGAIN